MMKIEKIVKGHKSRKGKSVGKIYLPEEWIGKTVVVRLKKDGV